MDIFVIIEAILKMILIGMMGFTCGLFSYLLDYCFWRGSIFQFYLPWLAKKILSTFAQAKYKEILLLESSAQEQNLIQEAEQHFFYKMLGGCSVCFNMWLSMLSYTIICLGTFFEWYYCFPYILVSSWNIRRLVKATY